MGCTESKANDVPKLSYLLSARVHLVSVSGASAVMFGARAFVESFAVAQVPSSQSAFDGMRHDMWVLPVSKLLEMQGPPLHHQRLIEAHCTKLDNAKCRAVLGIVTCITARLCRQCLRICCVEAGSMLCCQLPSFLERDGILGRRVSSSGGVQR